jgi:hypothetical protein
MLVLITISLFIFIPLVMLLLYLVRPRFNVQGFLAVLTVIAGLILVFLARPAAPRAISLPEWEPSTLFTLSPSLLIDRTAWYFALALASLVLAIVVTSITRLGQITSTSQARSTHQVVVDVKTGSREGSNLSILPANSVPNHQTTPAWLAWASTLVLTSLGLLAVTSGNILTLVLAWVALDILELAILLSLIAESRTCERIILAFSARMAGLCVVMVAGVLLWSKGAGLTFDAISEPISTILVLAAGLRLGVLPLHLPYPRGLSIDRNFGTALRLVPAVSSYILLVRMAGIGVMRTTSSYLIGFTILAGLYAAINWLRADDEADGRPYWLLGCSSLVVASAILQLPTACLVWSLTCLLSGGLIFSMQFRHKNLLPITVLGIFNLSSLPFSPAWQATSMYQYSTFLGINLPLFALFSLSLILIQAFILAGFIRHISRGIIPAAAARSEQIERWVWLLYPSGLVLILITHLLIGWMLYPNLLQVPLSGWFIGPVVTIFAGLILYTAWRSPKLVHPSFDLGFRSVWDRFFSFNWMYLFLWRLFRTLSRIFGLISAILEGDGGLLWALVIFGLIFVFLKR